MSSEDSGGGGRDSHDGAKASLVGVIKARGLLSVEVQRQIVRYADRGALNVAILAVAECLLSSSGIPAQGGILTSDLDELAAAGIGKVVDDYTNAGGALTAKYDVRDTVVAAMHALWRRGFHPPMRAKLVTAVLSKEEIQTRLTLAAQSFRAVIGSVAERIDTSRGVVFKVLDEDMERLCVALSVAALEVLEAPDAVNHRLIHGIDSV